MKKTLREELERIHTLTYGKKVIEEQGFLDRLFGKKDKSDSEKKDDPKKADFVSDDVAEFYKTIENAISMSGLTQQSGGITYQKEVESMQIGLVILGYDLPVHGIDGLFGPETAAAVSKFTKEKVNGDTNASINEAFVRLGDTSYPNVKFDKDGTQYDEVNQALLDDLQTAADKAGVTLTITTAKTGHSNLTINGKASRHATNTAVDIAILDGVSAGGATNETNGNSKFRELGNRVKDALLSLGYASNAEGGNQKAVLWQTNTGGNHYNHLHVSNNEGVSGSAGTSMVKATPEMLTKLLELLKAKPVTSEELKKHIDAAVTTGGGAQFTDLDLTTEEGFKAYSLICTKFIATRPPNLLDITGDMMANAARESFRRYRRYVPPELALAQLAAEGGIGNNNPQSRPIKTRNPFNVGNTDSGADVYHNSVESGIQRYYDLIARDYLVKGKTANDLVQNFVNKNGLRYATAKYEPVVNKIAGEANRIAAPIYASLDKKQSSSDSMV
jgi:hypothetical protein